MFKIRHKGRFEKTDKYFKDVIKAYNNIDFDRYGRMGVSALASATPVDSGITSKSWYYKVVKTRGITKLQFHNSNIQNGIPIAIILQYGHGTRTGGWVEGRDYINPAIKPIFDTIARDLWREVSGL